MTNRICKILLLFLLPLYLIGCGYEKREKAEALDRQIGAINDTLLVHAKKWGDEFKIAINTLDFSTLYEPRMKMQQYIDEKIEEMENVAHVGGSEELVKKELEYLRAEREIVTQKFAVFEQFTDSVAIDTLGQAFAEFQLSEDVEGPYLNQLHQLREEYAERNGFPKYIEKY